MRETGVLAGAERELVPALPGEASPDCEVGCWRRYFLRLEVLI